MKNKIKKIALWLSGAFCAVLVITGAMLAIFTNVKLVGIIVGIVYICLSLCFGMLAPNPLSVFGLGFGIAMIFVPGWIMGIILGVFGLGGMIAVPIVASKLLRKKA